MRDGLKAVRKWASRCTLRQLYTEIEAWLPKGGYTLELEGDTLTVYSVTRHRGFLGLGARQIRRPCLAVVRHNEAISVPEEHADPEFIKLLSEKVGAQR